MLVHLFQKVGFITEHKRILEYFRNLSNPIALLNDLGVHHLLQIGGGLNGKLVKFHHALVEILQRDHCSLEIILKLGNANFLLLVYFAG